MFFCKKPAKTATYVIPVSGMSCGHCAARVEQALTALPNTTAKVDLAAATVTVTSALPAAKLCAAITAAGYQTGEPQTAE